MSLCSRSTAFQAALLISWCLTLQAGVDVVDLVLLHSPSRVAWS